MRCMSMTSMGEPAPNARKLARVHGMAGALIDELHRGELDGPSRSRLERLTHDSLVEVGSAVPDDLLEELHRLVPPADGPTVSQAELRVLWAQMLGWINGVALGERIYDVRALVQRQHEALSHAAEKPMVSRIGDPYL